MSTNTQTVDAYLDGFRRTDHELILSCLTDDVEWLIPGAFHVHGVDAFAGHIVDEGFTGNPEILVSRMTEAAMLCSSRGRSEHRGWMALCSNSPCATCSRCGTARSASW